MKNSQAVLASLTARNGAWGLHPRTLAALAAVARGELRAEDLDEARPQAARGDSSTTGGVAMLALRGLITPRPSLLSMLFGGGSGLLGFRSSLREAVASEDVTAVVLDIDSPGGSTDLLVETAAEIRAVRAVKPVVAVANTWAASAAYWLASQADELVVTPSGEVGSIGVFQLHEDWSKFDEEAGVITTLISAGRFKTEGNPYEPLSDEGREAIQATIDIYYEMFVSDVAKGRGATPAAVRGGYGEGRMVTATQAVELGMADRVDTLEATIARLVRNPRRSRKAEDFQGNPSLNSTEVDEQEAARTRAKAVELLTAPVPSF